MPDNGAQNRWWRNTQDSQSVSQSRSQTAVGIDDCGDDHHHHHHHNHHIVAPVCMGRRPWSAASRRSRTEGAGVTSPPSHHRPQTPSYLLPLQLSQQQPARLFPLATAARHRPPAARPPAGAAASAAAAGGGGGHDELLQYVGPLRPLVVPAHPLLPRVVWHRRLCRCPVPARRPLAHLSPVRNKQPGRQAGR